MFKAALRALAYLALTGLAFTPIGASAQGKDELWEVSTQMNMPGMPPGMGATTAQVCRDKAQQGVQPQDMEKGCKVSDTKKSGNRVTMTITCPDSKAFIEQTYNAAGTEFKSNMRMTSKDGEMTMASSGRKVGTCDAQQARQKQEAQIAQIKGQADAGMAMLKKQNDEQIRQCGLAVETMEMSRLGLYGQCKQAGEACTSHLKDPTFKPVASACNARRAEFCKRYQTEGGFLKAKGDERAAQMCDVSAPQIRANLCPKAVQAESLDFLGRFCLEESKPLAQKHCAGRDYTAMRADKNKQDKYANFCLAHLSEASLQARPGTTQAPATDPAKATSDAVNRGISEGVNKLRGLFGR